VYEVATLTVDLIDMPKHQFEYRWGEADSMYYELSFDIEISAMTSLVYAVSIDGTRYGSVVASYR
jgi:hypothetical protein